MTNSCRPVGTVLSRIAVEKATIIINAACADHCGRVPAVKGRVGFYLQKAKPTTQGTEQPELEALGADVAAS